MGLPLWRDPDERRNDTATVAKPRDVTAAARSSIRRRPSIHGSRNPSRRYARYFVSPPRDISESRASAADPIPATRRTEHRDVPSIANLLEPTVSTAASSSNRSSAPSSARSNDLGSQSSTSNIDQLMERLGERRRASRSGNDERERDRSARHDYRSDWMLPAPRQQPVPWQASNADSQSPRVQARSRYNTLPTPPYETTSEDVDIEPIYSGDSNVGRRSHPLSNSWRPDSPMDGLGDRNRSPTPADGWEIMRSTIAPDENLPSAHSSFASTAASRSFTTSNSVALTDVDGQSDSIATVVPDDLACLEDATSDNEISGALADRVYQYEMRSQTGSRRIRQLRTSRSLEGNRFALAHEPEHVDIGFRLIEEHLETPEGRALLTQLGVINSEEEMQRRFSLAWSRRPRNVNAAVSSRETNPERSRPHLYIPDAPRAQERDHDRVRSRASFGNANGSTGSASPASANTDPRDNVLSLTLAPISQETTPSTASSYGPNPDTNLIRDDAAAANSSAGLSATDERERGHLERLLRSDSTSELDELRRIWPRLARPGDVPDDWWASIGLLLSRTRPDGPDSLLLDEVSNNTSPGRREERNSPRL